LYIFDENQISMKFIKTLFVVLFFVGLSTPAFTQVSLVPASHQVYEWLHLQRVKGNITNYSYETLPLTRKQILKYLRELENSSTLNSIDSELLRWYIQEFSPEQLVRDSRNTYTTGLKRPLKDVVKEKVDLLFSSKEPHYFVFNSDSIQWAVDYFTYAGALSANVPDQNIDGSSALIYRAIRTYGTIYDRIGAHLEIFNPTVDEAGLLRYHPEWGQTFDGRRIGERSTLFAEAYATFQYKQLGIHIGNGDLKYGTKGSEAQILRQEAGNFDWFRINFDTKYFQYTFIHGALKTETVTVDVDGYPGVRSRISPERWFALRRFQITPAKWISMAFTESLTYSNRPAELAYANPLLPLRFGEYETLDKDNPIWFFEGNLRPINNLELYATIGVDDLLNFSDIFKTTGNRASEDAVISYQAGLNFTLPTSTLLNAEIIQFDPYFYTHWQFFNTYDELGSPLGASIGPNSRQYYLSVRQWLPWRSFIDVSVNRVKKGLNELDENGNLTLDVGGDLFEGQSPTDQVRLFAGDVHEWNELRVQLEIEPFRGLRLYGTFNKRIIDKGMQLNDFDGFYFGVEGNFYPGVIPFMGLFTR